MLLQIDRTIDLCCQGMPREEVGWPQKRAFLELHYMREPMLSKYCDQGSLEGARPPNPVSS